MIIATGMVSPLPVEFDFFEATPRQTPGSKHDMLMPSQHDGLMLTRGV
jgi:hypothetical protein